MPPKTLLFLFFSFLLLTAPEYCWRPWTSHGVADPMPVAFYLAVSENWIPLCALPPSLSLPRSIKSVNHCSGSQTGTWSTSIPTAIIQREADALTCISFFSLSFAPPFFFLTPLMSNLIEPRWQRTTGITTIHHVFCRIIYWQGRRKNNLSSADELWQVSSLFVAKHRWHLRRRQQQQHTVEPADILCYWSISGLLNKYKSKLCSIPVIRHCYCFVLHH